MIPDSIKSELEKELSGIGGIARAITSSRPLSGGSINSAYEITTSDNKNYFLKYNLDSLYPGMFDAEKKGLNLLHATKEIRTPEVIISGKADQYAYLLLQMITPGSISKNFFRDLGNDLARLHQHTKPVFGLDHHNYIGSLRQTNTSFKSFSDFFINMRLEPLAQKAIRSGLLPAKVYEGLESLYMNIDNLIPTEPPALLHGDLWNGNKIIGPEGNAWLIDPAVYYGHRETDLAMTLLFGGFDTDFYNSYNETNPLALGWRERVDIHNLYPLLVHLNLFGTNYLPQIMQTISKFT